MESATAISICSEKATLWDRIASERGFLQKKKRKVASRSTSRVGSTYMDFQTVYEGGI
jgi:hypothetical protein